MNIARYFLIILKNLQQKHFKLLKNTQQNNSETATNKHDKELPIDRYISRRKIENYWWSKIIIVA